MAQNLIIPQIYADAVTQKMDSIYKVRNLATSLPYLEGTQEGDTVHFPQYSRIGEASDVTKGVPVTAVDFNQTDSTATMKQVASPMVRIYDRDAISVVGDPVGNSIQQQAEAIAYKIDADLCATARTTSLKQVIANAKSITENEMLEAMGLFGDSQDASEFNGIVINSQLLASFYTMDSFVDKNKTFTSQNSGIIQNGLCGFWHGIGLYLANHGTYDSTTGECITYFIKKNALAFMQKTGVSVEANRPSGLFCTDVVSSTLYATAITDSKGIVIARKTVA